MEIITTHRNTDFDALASVIAASLLYPDAAAVLPKTRNPNVKAFLSIHKDLFNITGPGGIDPQKVTRLIVVDTDRWSRLDRLSELKEKDGLEIMMWDHHTGGDIDATWKCQETTGSTITLLMREIKKQKIALTPMHATLFLTGLYEDTGGMSFPSTTAEDAYAAAFLLENKADLKILNTFLGPVYSEKQKDIFFKMLRTADRTRVNGFSISFNIVEVEGHVHNLSVVVHRYREIVNVDAAFAIFLDRRRDVCMVIGRSSTEELNVGSIMRSMGGGGHPAAGSAMIKSVKPGIVQEMIIGLIQGNQHSSVRVSDLMSFPVVTVSADTTMADLAAILRSKGCTGVPVVDDGKLVGIISRRDFRRLKNESQLKRSVKTFMTRDPVVVEPGRSPVEAARLMVKHDIGRLPVVEEGKIIGIITRSDTMIYFYDLMPE